MENGRETAAASSGRCVGGPGGVEGYLEKAAGGGATRSGEKGRGDEGGGPSHGHGGGL